MCIAGVGADGVCDGDAIVCGGGNANGGDVLVVVEIVTIFRAGDDVCCCAHCDCAGGVVASD